jgi:hypothetical protein
VGTYFAPKLFETRDGLKELSDAAQEFEKIASIDVATGVATLADEFEELSAISKEYATSVLLNAVVVGMEAAKQATEEFNDAVDDISVSMIATATLAQAGITEIDILADKYGIAAEQAVELANKQLAVQAGLEGSEQALANFVTGLAEAQFVAGEELEPELVELSRKLQDYRKEIDQSAKQQEVLNEILHGNVPATEAVAEANEKAAEASKAHFENVQGIIRGIREQIIAIDEGAEAALRYRLANQGLTESEIDLIAALENVRREAAEQKRLSEESAEADRRKAEEKKNFVESINEQAAALGKTSIELLREQAAIHGVTAELEEAFGKLEKFKQDQEAATDRQRIESNVEAIRQSLLSEEEALLESHQKKLADLDEALNNEVILQERYNETKLRLIADFEQKKADLQKKSGDQEILQGDKLTGHMLDQLGKQFSGVQAANRKMFAAQKAYKIAKATQNTYDAANEALASPYPWPLPQIFAATAVAAGLANVAAIKSSSFEGGGFTGMGARAGGIDGKGGFPAILHPNETVVDHTKGQSQGITIINNVDASGAGADVDMKIAAAMQQTSQQTIASVQDLMRRRRM